MWTFLAESRYRDKLASGRILARDVEALIHEYLGTRGARDVAGTGTRFDLWRAVVLHGIPAAAGRELLWILEETPALSRFRMDVPANARSALSVLNEEDDRGAERKAVRRLWGACLEAVRRAGELPVTPVADPVRHRDWLQVVYGLDTDAWIHPPLIRFLAGYLDQGLHIGPCPKGLAASTAVFWRSTARPWLHSVAFGHEPCRSWPPMTTLPDGMRSAPSHTRSLSSASAMTSGRNT